MCTKTVGSYETILARTLLTIFHNRISKFWQQIFYIPFSICLQLSTMKSMVRKNWKSCFTWCFFLRSHFLTERNPAFLTAPVQLKLAALPLPLPCKKYTNLVQLNLILYSIFSNLLWKKHIQLFLVVGPLRRGGGGLTPVPLKKLFFYD